jgi:hypothetical protein
MSTSSGGGSVDASNRDSRSRRSRCNAGSGAREKRSAARRPGALVEQAIELVALERHRHQCHALRALERELLAAAQQDDAVFVHFAPLHARRLGELAERHGKADLAVGQTALLDDALAHPLAKDVEAVGGRLGERAAHRAAGQLQVALMPLGRRGAVHVEVVEHVELERHAIGPQAGNGRRIGRVAPGCALCRFGLTARDAASHTGGEALRCRYAVARPS